METDTQTIKIDGERQKEARVYAVIRRRLMVVDLLVGWVYALAWLVFGWSAGLKQSLLGLTDSPWLLVLLYAAIFVAIYFLINLPLAYYSEFVLPHRFGQSNQNLRSWVLDQVKGILVGAVIGSILLEVIYAVLRAYPDTWWLVAAGIMLVFSVLLANLAPVLLFPIFYKFTPLGAEHQELADRLMRLSEQAGTRVKGVYQFDMSSRTNAANAALTGLGGTRRIILGDTLLKEFTTEEIETVLAHELGHHVNNDVWLSIAVETVSTVVGLWLASLALKWGAGAFGLAGPADIAALPVFALAMGLFGLVTMPLTNGFTRWRESLADRYALESTHKTAAFAAAMTRLANQNLAELEPEPWVEFLLYSHPALSKRIKMAEEWKG
jgi:STE24 endopeptidase